MRVWPVFLVLAAGCSSNDVQPLPDASDEKVLRLFLREARVNGQLDHPNIVPVYDIGEGPDGSLFFTMKLVNGKTLKELVKELPEGPIDSGTLFDLLDVVIKCCDALAFAHARGVVHCDVKPENVMVGDYGQVCTATHVCSHTFRSVPCAHKR